jgi:Cu/Ag efflux protein CusF/cytochrome c553
MKTVFGRAALWFGLLIIGPALAQDHEEHGDHGDHGGGAQAVGVVNSIDAAGRSVNVTHEPIPDLGWPTMTMDMNLSDNASLDGIEEGAAVTFTLKKGTDGMYQIDSIMPAGDHGMEHGDHSMNQDAAGDWAYTNRDSPSPTTAGRWEMVPVAGTRGAEWVASNDMDMAARCALLQENALAMVDAATRAACAGDGPATPVLEMAAAGSDHHGAMEMEDGAGHHDTGAQEAPSHGAHWMAPDAAQGRKNPTPADHESIARGAVLFKTNCVLCHGPSGRGDGAVAASLDPRPADLVVMAGMHPAGDFAWKIANGRGMMPAWNELLSEAEIWDLVNFIKRLPEMAETKTTPAAASDGHDDHDHHHD